MASWARMRAALALCAAGIIVSACGILQEIFITDEAAHTAGLPGRDTSEVAAGPTLVYRGTATISEPVALDEPPCTRSDGKAEMRVLPNGDASATVTMDGSFIFGADGCEIVDRGVTFVATATGRLTDDLAGTLIACNDLPDGTTDGSFELRTDLATGGLVMHLAYDCHAVDGALLQSVRGELPSAQDE